jgi:hypothetical protein
MSDTETYQPEPTLAPSPPRIQVSIKKPLPSLQEARSYHMLDQLVQQMVQLDVMDDQSKAAIHRRRQEIRRLLIKTRRVAWIWGNVYGYGDDDLFPEPLYDREAAYLAAVQPGVILVLDVQRRRVACFVSDDGCAWKRYSIHRNAPFNNNSIYACRIKRFPRSAT